ncbi:glycosyltransferase [Limosilactobacillus pontis]|uniref:glycosyltransferase n=1 Tax=Limosilactobacillus pontis TaxID=35787 RepID=UPI002F26CA6B
MRVLGGIVTYNPEIERFKDNISSLLNQVDFLYLFDNCSKNFDDIEKIISKFSQKICVYRSKSNVGIADGLVHVMNFAQDMNYDWVLTVDQDSVLDNNLVEQYKIAINKYKKNDLGMLTCLIKDRNFVDKATESQNDDLMEVPICITAGALTNVKKYFLTVGYDKSMFIDLVDTDLCLSLREKGFKILRINYLGLYQEIGHGENKKLFMKNIIVHHSNVFREYYMVRNSFILNKRHPIIFNKTELIKSLTLNLFITLFYENNRLKRLKQYVRGIKDGMYKRY